MCEVIVLILLGINTHWADSKIALMEGSTHSDGVSEVIFSSSYFPLKQLHASWKAVLDVGSSLGAAGKFSKNTFLQGAAGRHLRMEDQPGFWILVKRCCRQDEKYPTCQYMCTCKGLFHSLSAYTESFSCKEWKSDLSFLLKTQYLGSNVFVNTS